MRAFSREDFARFHPAGDLGRRLAKVDHHLRPLEQCRVAPQTKTVREVFVTLSVPGRRTGAIMLVDEAGRLTGLFTDSDLARLFERHRDPDLDGPIAQVMTARPVTVELGSMMIEAVTIMARRKISELPVVDAEGKPVGLIDVTDVVGLLPKEATVEETLPETPAAPDGSPPRPHWRLFREPEAGETA
jgi:arabinose-5-phosphate isomerase